jgi:hypothetical protein
VPIDRHAFFFLAPAEPSAAIIAAVRKAAGRYVPALAAGLLAAAGARAEPTAFGSPAGGATLLAGTTVTVEWSLDPGATEHVGEMELVLSLDGGRMFSVRVTEELEPDVTRIDWSVPSLPTAHARLALRTGAGSAESETIRLVSEEFEIVEDGLDPEESILRMCGEWRTRDSLVLSESKLPPRRTIDAEPTLSSGNDPSPIGASPRVEPLEAQKPNARRIAGSTASTSRLAGASTRPIRLAPLPLRE